MVKVRFCRLTRLISAVGVAGNVENLGLEALGVKIERGIIATDGFGRTNVPGLYAIGDVAGPPMLAHKAEHEGVICVEAIAGRASASAGPRHDSRLHLLQSADRLGRPHRGKSQGGGHQLKIGRFPFIGNGKAIALGEPEGLTKTIFDAETGDFSAPI